MERWSICTGPMLAAEAAIAAAIEDLERDGERYGLTFEMTPEPPPSGNVILVGDAMRNPATAPRLNELGLRLDGPADPEGFEIRTRRRADGRVIAVAGGSVVGDEYGLYWLWDRMRVFGRIPDLDLKRSPALPIRLTEATTGPAVRNALRHTANWVSGFLIDDLVPWDVEPEATRNAAQRENAAPLIEAAHACHMKFLAVADEFSYHPTLLERFGAGLDPADPALWDALQEKYRRLFDALPALDGVRIRTGELTRVTGSYRPFDVMHEPADSDWPLERRYRTFVQKMHEVVVGEFDKIYFQRTWVTNTTEQHSNPDVFKRIFTDSVPTCNLYLSPYLSTADRWYYQPYNPTFNLTPHAMIVLLSRLDYHASGNGKVFPSFPGQYYRGGLEAILSKENANLRGVHFNVPLESSWDTGTLTAYTAFRLAWEPTLDVRTIAEDFAAIHLGRDVAPEMAEILLLSYQAYKDGIYIKPVAEALSWNTLPHLRLTAFPAKGYPFIDHGKAHIEWLESSMYQPSKGHIDEALAHLDRGRDAARKMSQRYRPLAPKVADSRLARQVGDALELTRLLVETNNLYVKTCFAYFQYREKPCPETKERLAQTVADLKATRAAFLEAPGFEYQLFGIDQLIVSADEALDDLTKAEAALEQPPDSDGVRQAILAQQEKHAAALRALQEDAVKFLSWKGKVDGKDILSIRGDSITIDHVQDDPIHSVECRFDRKLPEREVTVLVRDLESRTLHPFVLEQPTNENDYTFKLYLADRGRGYAWWVFELYYVERTPEDVGLAVPWQ